MQNNAYIIARPAAAAATATVQQVVLCGVLLLVLCASRTAQAQGSGRTFVGLAGQAIIPSIGAIYNANEPVHLSWHLSQPDPGQLVWYELAIDNGDAQDFVQLDKGGLTYDSLPAGDYAYQIVAHSLTDSIVTRGTFTIAGVNSTNPLPGTPDIRIFPNPVQGGGTIHILLTGLTDGPTTIKLYDMRGNVIDLTNLHRDGDQLSVRSRELAKGVYRCEIVASNGVRWSAPLIVE